MDSHSAASVPTFGHGQDLKKWIQLALEQPFNATESNSNKAIQDYDQIATIWEYMFLTDWNHYKDTKTLKELQMHLPFGPKAIVLDLGGATGRLARFLVQSGLAGKVISLDISPKMTEQVRQEFDSLSLSVKNETGKPPDWELIAVCADMTMPIENQPKLKKLLSNGTVDVIVSLRAFSTLPPATATQTLKSMRTLLRPDGRILIDNKPPRPFLRHAVCIPKAFGKGSKYPKVSDLIIHGFVDRSVLVFDHESPALINLQNASLNNLANHSGLKLQHMTHGYLPERGISKSTNFLSFIRNRLNHNTPPYDELSAPPEKMFEVMQWTFNFVTTTSFRAFTRMWREEVGVNFETKPGWVAHPETSEYYAVFSLAESMG
jgi:SAM-dependent methyltransferase